mgnify:CR=1 FL=1
MVTPSAAPKGYYQHVPLFSDVLDVVAGRAPLIVEYKFSNNRAWDERSEELMEKGHALLEAYDGPYVIESFHPGAVNWYKEHHPEVCRGQLSWPAKLSKNGAAEWAAGLLAFDWLSRPDFVAYDWTGGASPQVKLARSMGAMPVSWTVRSSDELAQCAPYFDRHIFEELSHFGIPPHEDFAASWGNYRPMGDFPPHEVWRFTCDTARQR